MYNTSRVKGYNKTEEMDHQREHLSRFNAFYTIVDTNLIDQVRVHKKPQSTSTVTRG